MIIHTGFILFREFIRCKNIHLIVEKREGTRLTTGD